MNKTQQVTNSINIITVVEIKMVKTGNVFLYKLTVQLYSVSYSNNNNMKKEDSLTSLILHVPGRFPLSLNTDPLNVPKAVCSLPQVKTLSQTATD
jgi:hypothetical protein